MILGPLVFWALKKFVLDKIEAMPNFNFDGPIVGDVE